jgi:aryl-alcohol dehydrogenase-like predicted oxidoreductase
MWGGTEEQQSIATIHAALERGITMIDTAPAYGFGRAEEIVGRALAEGGRREKVLVATKVGLNWRDGQVFRDASPRRIRQEIEDSLRRLQTDRIDLYQVHWPDASVPIEETARELDRLLRAGKIRAIGVSNFSADEMERFRAVAPLHSVQPPYNLFEREAETEVLRLCGAPPPDCACLRRALPGSAQRADAPATKFGGDDLRRVDPKFQQPRYGQYLAAVDALAQFARERYGRSVLALAVRWILDPRRDDSAVGCSPARTARSGCRRHWLVARYSGATGDRGNPATSRQRLGRPAIHGTAAEVDNARRRITGDNGSLRTACTPGP